VKPHHEGTKDTKATKNIQIRLLSLTDIFCSVFFHRFLVLLLVSAGAVANLYRPFATFVSFVPSW